VVGAEMDNYEPGIYTERVLEAVKVLRDQGKYTDILGIRRSWRWR
jgi:catenin alpha